MKILKNKQVKKHFSHFTNPLLFICLFIYLYIYLFIYLCFDITKLLFAEAVLLTDLGVAKLLMSSNPVFIHFHPISAKIQWDTLDILLSWKLQWLFKPVCRTCCLPGFSQNSSRMWRYWMRLGKSPIISFNLFHPILHPNAITTIMQNIW